MLASYLIRVIDLETTGFPPDAEPIEIAKIDVLVAPFSLPTIGASPFSALVKPSRPVPPESSAVHHLVDEDLVNAAPWAKVWPAFVEGADIFCAHNPAFAFLSMEPLLGQVDLSAHLWGRASPCADCPRDVDCGCGFYPRGACEGEATIDWIITGGETDQGVHKARPAHPDWFRSIRDQCAAAGVAYHHKQNGEWKPICWMADGESDDFYHPAPHRDPEGIRRCKVDHTVMNRDGSLHPRASDPECYRPGDGSMLIFKTGKKAAGRLLDGVEHNARPEVVPCAR